MEQDNSAQKSAFERIIAAGQCARVSLANGSDSIILKIRNNGLPFPDLKSRSTGMGLRIMNYRASLIGGSLEIKGSGPRGTCVTCSVPIEAKK